MRDKLTGEARSFGCARVRARILRGATDLFRYSLGLGLRISGNSAETLLYLAANVSGGPAHTIFIHGTAIRSAQPALS